MNEWVQVMAKVPVRSGFFGEMKVPSIYSDVQMRALMLASGMNKSAFAYSIGRGWRVNIPADSDIIGREEVMYNEQADAYYISLKDLYNIRLEQGR